MSNARFSIIQAKAVRDPRVSDSMLRTLCALGLYSDADGWCFPRQNTLADDTGKSRQTVNDHIGKLAEFGYVQIVHQFREDGSQTANKYRLLFDTPLSSLDLTPPVKPRLDSINDPSNDPYNTASGENSPSAIPLPLEWQIAAGVDKVVVPDAKDAKYRDTADLIATGMGILAIDAFKIAYTFMTTRGIIIPAKKISAQRKAVIDMIEMGVKPEHVAEATRMLVDNKMTVTDLFSISKTAIALANPAPEKDYNGPLEGV